jgi:hypothetical protein
MLPLTCGGAGSCWGIGATPSPRTPSQAGRPARCAGWGPWRCGGTRGTGPEARGILRTNTHKSNTHTHKLLSYTHNIYTNSMVLLMLLLLHIYLRVLFSVSASEH